MEKTISYQGESFTLEIQAQGPTLLPDGRCVAFNGILAPGVAEIMEEAPVEESAA